MSDLIISNNVGCSNNLSGLNQIISLFNPIFIFLQEVTISTEQLLSQLNSNYLGMCNIDTTDGETRKPGTAILWMREIEAVVIDIVPQRLQLLKSTLFGTFVNIYAPTGSQGERARNLLFSHELLNLVQTTTPKPILIGDWNCLSRKEDVENWETLGADSLNRRISLPLKCLI